MVKLSDFEIDIEGFAIYDDVDSISLSMGKRSRDLFDDSGGIGVKPLVEITAIETGRCYVTQICTRHELIVEVENGESHKFDSSGEQFKDGNGNFYWYNAIENSKLVVYGVSEMKSSLNQEQRIPYRDRLHMKLLPWWRAVSYDIEFITCFQYSLNPLDPNALVSICEFAWSASAYCEQVDGKWILRSENHSSKKNIEESIRHYELGEKFADVSNMKNILSAVLAFFDTIPALGEGYGLINKKSQN